MKEFKTGSLHSGKGGKVVKSPKQAIAIALSEAGMAKKKGKEVLAVQTTTAGNMSARVKKIGDHENVGHVREAGWTIHVHGWHQDDKKKWHCKIKDVS